MTCPHVPAFAPHVYNKYGYINPINMKNIYLLSNPAKTVVSPRTVGVSLPSRCRVLPIILLFLTAFNMQVWGADETEDFTSLGTQTWTSYSLTSGDVTISTDLNGGSAPTTSNAQYRWKTDNIITISLSSGTITSIRFKTNSTATYGPQNLSYGGSAITTSGTDYTWSAPSSMSSASFTVTSEARLTEIHVKYTPGSSSCSTDPTVGNIMNAVSSITATGATFSTSAGVSAGTDCSLDEVGFVYNTTGTPTTSDTKAVIDSYTSGNLNKSVTGLSASTTYYVRAYAKNEHSTTYSDEKSFSTPALVGVAYELVTSNSDLEDGAEIIILDTDGENALSTTQNSNNRSSTTSGFTLSGSTATVTGDNIEVITLTESSTNWELVTHDSKYLYTVSNNNYLRTQSTNTNAGVWTITINSTTHVATIYCSNTSRYLKKNGSSALFATYSSGQKDVKIYKKPSGPIKVTSSFTEFTYVLGSGPSGSQTFKVEGTDLDGNLTITAPTNYQVSQNGSSWSNSVTLNKNAGDDVPETTLYIRLNSGLAKGDYDGNITFSDGTNNKTVAVEGSVTLACATPSISFTEATVNKYRGDADFKITPSVSGNTLGAVISWSSDKESCATVGADGTVHIVKATGEGAYVRITATLPYTETAVACQNEVSAYYDIYIKNKVTWLVSGATYSVGGPDTEVTEGAKITTAPTDPNGSSMCGGKTFVGWTTSEVAVEQSSAPDPLYSATTVKDVNITDNTTFYAVFAEETLSPTSTTFSLVADYEEDFESGKDYVLANYYSSKDKALNATVTGTYYLTGTDVTIPSSNTFQTSNGLLVWKIKTEGTNQVSLYNEETGKYAYLYHPSGTYYDLGLRDDKYLWTISYVKETGYSAYFTFTASDYSSYILAWDNSNSRYAAKTSNNGYLYLYKKADEYTYAAYSTTCGPNIKADEVERLTSTQGQIVKSQAITIKGSNLTGSSLSVKNITGDASQFACVLASQTITAGAIETTYTITYTPTVYDATHTAEIIFWDGTTESDPITLRGRSLPQQFAIVAFDGANYYALNGSMSGLASMVKPLPVTVTAGAVDLCPNQAIYSLTERETPDKNVYLVGPGADGSGARLWGGSDTKLNTKSLTSTDQTGWLLTTSDFSTYHITNADVTTRGIMYYSTSDAFGHYATSQYGTANYYGDIQLLPITEVCTCLPAPFPTAVARATSVTITWGEVTGAVSYVVTCSGGSAPVYDGCKATITGLTNNTNYTYTVKAVASGNDCSLVYSGNFTTTDCDDVPYAISVAPALTSATFRWSMEAASATIRIYSDEECTAQVGSDHTGLTSPATITGLDENTTYYAKIWAGGTCVSAVTSFTTNSPSVELAEWFPDSIRIVLNADTANATVVIEDKNDLGDHATSVANDIFFSKYFEASGFTKLVGLYNGTDHDIDLAQLVIKGGESRWTTKKGVNNYIKLSDVSKLVTDYGDGAGHIYLPRGKEIILYSIQKSNKSGFTGAGCIDEYYDWDELADDNVADWYRIGGYESDVVDDDGHKTLNFPGKVSVSLWRNSTMIDLIGAGNSTAPTSSATTTVTTSHTLGNGRTISCPNDKPGFWSEEGWSPRPQKGDPDFALYPNGYSTYLTTNRCLLVRANHVVSGDSAILNNTSTFKTLGAYEGVDGKSHKAEWVGIPIGNDGTSDERDCLSGGQFGYVGAYDYNAYYATFDSIADLKELGGSQNPDGTYTIEIPHLDTLSCTSLKINVYEGSVVQASKTYQVPIMVTTEKAGGWSTTDTIFQNKWHDLEACEKCDVVILKGATLTKAENGLPKDAATIGNLTIYPGGTMNIPTSRTFNVASVQFRVEGENVPFIKLAGTLETADKQVLVSRRINNSDAYFFSLPYDCNISDIRWSNGVPAILDDGFRIKEYDSRARADEGSTKGAPGHWKMVTGSTLEAGKGYQISVNNRYLRELIFPLDLGKTNVSDAENEKAPHGDNIVPIHQYENGATTINNHNWNFIAQPYLCAMSPMAGADITYGYLEYEIEDEEVKWYRRLEGNQYLTIYNPSTKTYDQIFWNSVSQLDPFVAFFVQGKREGSFTFTEGNRKNNAPARHLASQAEVDEDPSIFVGVTLSGNGLTDQANLRVRQDFTEDEYKLGYDLLKFTTYYKDRPQVYMKTPSYQLAFQAVSDSVAKNTWLPMGVYCYKPGTYTFGLSNDYPIDEVEAVYLYDKVAGVTTNLLYDTYSVTTSSQLYTNTRFALNVIVNRRAPQVTTDIGIPEAPDNMVRKILINGHVYIQRGAAIYDITGKQMLNF